MAERDGFQDNALNEMRETVLTRVRDPDLREAVAEVRTRLRQQIRLYRRVLHQLKRQREDQWGSHSGITSHRDDRVACWIVCLGFMCVILYALIYHLI